VVGSSGAGGCLCFHARVRDDRNDYTPSRMADYGGRDALPSALGDVLPEIAASRRIKYAKGASLSFEPAQEFANRLVRARPFSLQIIAIMHPSPLTSAALGISPAGSWFPALRDRSRQPSAVVDL
jgi:hypothetical protein